MISHQSSTRLRYIACGITVFAITEGCQHVQTRLPLDGRTGVQSAQYHYQETVTQVYHPDSVGLPVGTRELEIHLDWWISLARESVGGDSVKFNATIDSVKTQWLKTIPELGPPDEMMPPQLGRGAHLQGTLAVHQGLHGLAYRTDDDSLLGIVLLPLLLPDIQPSDGIARSDTTYEQHPALRLASVPQPLPPGPYDPTGSLGFWPDEPNPTQLRGALIQYVSPTGLLLAAKLNRTMHMAVPVLTYLIPGNGTWTATIDRVEASR